MFVLDASVAASWCLTDEADPYGPEVLRALATDCGLVSSIWPEELANVLLVAERRKRITSADVAVWVTRIEHLPITVDASGFENAFGPTLELARRQHLSVYDASYLALAFRQGLPLATLDADLRRAAAEIGVALYLTEK